MIKLMGIKCRKRSRDLTPHISTLIRVLNLVKSLCIPNEVFLAFLNFPDEFQDTIFKSATTILFNL